MADFIKDFENSVATSVEDIRGKQVSQGVELREESRNKLNEQVEKINKIMAEELAESKEVAQEELCQMKVQISEKL